MAELDEGDGEVGLVMDGGLGAGMGEGNTVRKRKRIIREGICTIIGDG